MTNLERDRLLNVSEYAKAYRKICQPVRPDIFVLLNMYWLYHRFISKEDVIVYIFLVVYGTTNT